MLTPNGSDDFIKSWNITDVYPTVMQRRAQLLSRPFLNAVEIRRWLFQTIESVDRRASFKQCFGLRES